MKVLQKRCHLNGHTIEKLELHTEKKVPCESIAEGVSFEWLHQRVDRIIGLRTSRKHRPLVLKFPFCLFHSYGIQNKDEVTFLKRLRRK